MGREVGRGPRVASGLDGETSAGHALQVGVTARPTRWAAASTSSAARVSAVDERGGERGGLLALAEVRRSRAAARVKKPTPTGRGRRRWPRQTRRHSRGCRASAGARGRAGRREQPRPRPRRPRRRRRKRSASAPSSPRGAGRPPRACSARSTAERLGRRARARRRCAPSVARAPLGSGAAARCARPRLDGVPGHLESATRSHVPGANSQHIDIGVLQCCQNEGCCLRRESGRGSPSIHRTHRSGFTGFTMKTNTRASKSRSSETDNRRRVRCARDIAFRRGQEGVATSESPQCALARASSTPCHPARI